MWLDCHSVSKSKIFTETSSGLLDLVALVAIIIKMNSHLKMNLIFIVALKITFNYIHKFSLISSYFSSHDVFTKMTF